LRNIAIRSAGLEGSNATGHKVNVHEIEPGDVYKDGNITVRPFPVKHGEWNHALGYRIEAPGRVIVYSGDTSPTESIVENCHGCDYLISEAYTLASFNLVSRIGKRTAAPTMSPHASSARSPAVPSPACLYLPIVATPAVTSPTPRAASSPEVKNRC